MIKLFIGLSLATLLLTAQAIASPYNEVTLLPAECYPTGDVEPDPVQVMPACEALADLQAGRSMQSQEHFYTHFYRNCKHPVTTIQKVYCPIGYSNYVSAYVTIKAMATYSIPNN